MNAKNKNVWLKYSVTFLFKKCNRLTVIPFAKTARCERTDKKDVEERNKGREERNYVMQWTRIHIMPAVLQ